MQMQACTIDELGTPRRLAQLGGTCHKSALKRIAFLLPGVVVAGLLQPEGVGAQVDTAAARAVVARAAASITAGAIAQDIRLLTADSLDNRVAPSRGLAQVAQYITDRFKEFGLKPDGSTGAWIQDYPIITNLVTLDYGGSRLYCDAGEQPATTVAFANGVYIAVDTVVESHNTQPALDTTSQSPVVVAGRQTPATIAAAQLQGRLVLYLPAPDADSTTQRQVIRQLYAANRVLVLSLADSATFARRQEAAAARPIRVMDSVPVRAPTTMFHWAAYARAEAIQGCLQRAGLDLARLQADTLATVQELNKLSVWAVIRNKTVSTTTETGKNVIGVLPAATNRLGNAEALVVSAHMDPGGVRPGVGANDKASGAAALLALARAFSQLPPAARPSRTIIFLATSGGAMSWGSTYWTDSNDWSRPIRANITLDMLSRSAGDSVWIDGLRDADWPARPDWLAWAHPELRLNIVDSGSAGRPESGYFAFVRHMVPSLFVHTDTHAAVIDTALDVPTAVDTGLAARIAQLVFYFTYELGSQSGRPVWTSEARRRFLPFWSEP